MDIDFGAILRAASTVQDCTRVQCLFTLVDMLSRSFSNCSLFEQATIMSIAIMIVHELHAETTHIALNLLRYS